MNIHETVEKIKQLKPNFTPKVGVILGSGLGPVAEQIEDAVVIPYEQIPGFPKCGVVGHGGNLHLGILRGTPVACLQGRAHIYEGNIEVIKTLIRTLKLLGCEILINTNAVKISDKLLSMASKFSNLQFVVSIDGYKQANDYSRWGSDWNTVIKNIKKIVSNGHKVTFNTVLSLYTIFHYKELVDFLDTQFPNCLIHSQFAENIYPFVFPFPADLKEKLETIKHTNAYNNDVLFSSFVDGVIRHAKSSELDKDKLQHFFNFNDTLDISRNSCLNAYIPELEKLRELL